MNYKIIKRIIDFLLVINLLFLLFPILVIVAIIVKIESEGPIIFKQKRIGKNGKEFEIYKFRTMAKDNSLLNFYEKDKVTRIGSFLRKYGIDELPQLFNILKGEMSFIGPRPQIMTYMQYYTQKQMKRFEVLPGILGPNTCLYAEQNILEKNRLDYYYVDNYSFKQDLEIIVNTIKDLKKILSFRETGSYGNKKIVEEELKCLRDNFEEEENEDKEFYRKIITNASISEYLNNDLKLTRKRKLK